jgi:hypothetical protein
LAIRKEFVDGTLSAERPALPSPAPILRDSRQNGYSDYDRDRAKPNIDNLRLHYFISNLPWQSLPIDELARNDVLQQWDDQFVQVALELTNGGETETKGRSVTIYHNEHELFRNFGQLAASCPTNAQMLRWAKSILEVLPYAPNHVEQFFQGVFTRLLSRESPDPTETERWLEIIELALGSRTPSEDQWNQDFGWHDWEHWLVGNVHLLRKFSWKKHHAVFIEGHASIYESWVRRMCRSNRDFTSMLSFLELPACEGIRARACSWIDEALSGTLPESQGQAASDSLASFLTNARTQVTQARRTRPGAFESFLNLTAMLNVKNNKLAMQLFEDVGTLG